ncbi:VOC family protein [Herbaspirillum sp. YR522]|uniref:VOC family protein n=1 Tax=Herbaspirillum sp. YR522 TaxID=1144342 RepID=UPI00026FA253|nr:VOC family protein [Herbaspirillum sp. YR522]EJN08906.1 4-hydroxyphenylpyruvate dioxygenase/hemolysin-like protein [Herbaspirillum sp. YR522]
MKYLAATLLAIALGGPVQAQGVSIAGIDHVGINVPDLTQAEDFFAQTFGCVALTHIGPFQLKDLAAAGPTPRADSVRLAMLRCGAGANIELFEYGNPSGSRAMPRAEDAGASHIAFYTDDVRAGAAYLKARGIKILGEPVTMASGDTEGETWVHFQSPWGAEMELVGYPQGKGYERRGGMKLWSPKAPAR